MNKLTFEEKKKIAELEERQRVLLSHAINSDNFEDQLQYLRDIDAIVMKIDYINGNDKNLAKERLVSSRPPQITNNKPMMRK